MTNDSGFWTDQRVLELRRLAATGMSSGDISIRLSGQFGELVSRNAVIGKRSRLGEPPRDDRAARLKREHRAKRPAPPVARPPDGFYAHPVPKLPLPEIDGQAISQDQRRTLMQLEDHHCRWPIDGSLTERSYLFCGATKADESSYCAAHKRRARGAGTPSERQASR